MKNKTLNTFQFILGLCQLGGTQNEIVTSANGFLLGRWVATPVWHIVTKIVLNKNNGFTAKHILLLNDFSSCHTAESPHYMRKSKG